MRAEFPKFYEVYNDTVQVTIQDMRGLDNKLVMDLIPKECVNDLVTTVNIKRDDKNIKVVQRITKDAVDSLFKDMPEVKADSLTVFQKLATYAAIVSLGRQLKSNRYEDLYPLLTKEEIEEKEIKIRQLFSKRARRLAASSICGR